MKSSLNLIRNKKKKILKKFLDDQIFQKSQFSICALHGIKFLMDFNWIRCISETLRKISFMASGSHAKITYVHLHTYVPGTNRAFTSFLHEKVGFRTCVAWATYKKRKNDYNATKRATTTHVSIVLDIKVHNVMEFSPYFECTRNSILWYEISKNWFF